jgi:FKBP-type peptidyl-prolyl cis-trans isomerase
MKHAVMVLMILLLVLPGCSDSAKSNKGEDETDTAISFDTDKQKESYVVGHDIARNFSRLLAVLDIDYFVKGFKDGAANKALPVSDEEKQKIVTQVRQKVTERDQQEREKLGKKNQAEGEKFLKENAQKQGVTVTPSGLQYMVLKEGDGPKPTPQDFVKVHYRGTLIDGSEFDNSQKRGEPLLINPDRVIKGWGEGLRLMKVGSKYRFFLPSDLAYGERGMGVKIGPHAVLIFDVELLSIEKRPESQKPKQLPNKMIPPDYKKPPKNK